MKRKQVKLKRFANTLQKILYPPSCPLCGELIPISSGTVCKVCRAELSYIQQPVCLRCGKEIMDEEQELCEDCSNHTRSYIRGFPAMNYVTPLSESVADFKYHNRRDYAEFYAQEIVRCRGREILAVNPEALIPVPIHNAKLKKRGYNQAEVLAQEIGNILHIPVDTQVIQRCVNTIPQKTLNQEEREKNLKNAFISTDKIVKYKRVILVDDIYTTGATIEACTNILKDKGITDVYYTSICIGKGY